jgi:hypothetical protein
MINDVVLEGIVVRAWKFADDLLLRLACYRDPDLPQKPFSEVKDAADYVTVRVPKGNLRVNDQRHFWIGYQEADENVCGIREDKGQMGVEVKTFAPVSHNALTTVEEYVQ